MKNKYLQLIVLVLITIAPVIAQNGSKEKGYAREKWKLKDPFEQKVFVENNEGQFDGQAGDKDIAVLYTTRVNGIDVYFTNTGLVYRYDEYPKINKEEEREEKKSPVPPTTYLFREVWEGAGNSPVVYAKDEVSFYYCYPKSCKHTTIAHAYKKLLYKNIYPNIDIEYSFKEDKKGIEYTIIVHPGGDLSKVRLSYPDAKNFTRENNGDIELKSDFGLFTDKAPERAYCQENNANVTVKYALSDDEINFEVGNYNHANTLVIDPFKTNPGFAVRNIAYDVCYDVNGNVYAYGAYTPFEEAKVNSAGTLQWIFVSVYPGPYGGTNYGDFAVDEVSGSSYLSSSGDAIVIKVNQLGIQTDSIDITSSINELWRMAYNRCENQIIIGSGGTAGNYQLGTLDTSLTTYNPVDVLGTTGGHHDDVVLTIDNTNKYVFMATAQSNVWATWNNILIKSPIPAFLPMVFGTPDGYAFYEGPTIIYAPSIAMNGIAASPDWVYMFDGGTLTRYNKNTGSTISSITVSPYKYKWGGVDVDICDHIYTSNDSVINVYDSSLAFAGNIPTGYQVNDLHIMPNNGLCAAGVGFISAYTITTNTMTIAKTRTNSGCGTFNGTASAKLTGCGSDSSQYNYLWSNGASTQQVSGLSAGTYTVTISSNCDFKFTDTVNIKGGSSGGITLTTTQKNLSCFGDSNGSASVTAAGGKPPYTYSWNPTGSTNSTITGLKPGIYVVSVSDSTGCADATVVITQPTAIVATIISSTNAGCKGGNTGSATVAASGGTGSYTYSWAPTGGTNATATALGSGVYTVSVTDANGCTGMVMDTIKRDSLPLAVITGKTNVCAGTPITLTATTGAGYTYLWNNGATTSSITVSPTMNTTYSVAISNGPCTADTNYSIVIIPLPKVSLTSTSTALCKGDSSTLTISGASTYLWSTGSTSTSITVSPTTTTTYSVQASNGTCIKDTSVTITVNTIPIAVVSGSGAICYGNSITLTASGGKKYKWIPATGLNCDTCAVVNANPASTTTYKVIAYNGNCTDTTTAKVTVSPLPTGSACCSDTIQMGDTTTLNALDSTATSFLWLPNTDLSCNTCPVTKASPQFTTTYTVTMAGKDGCEVVDSLVVFVEGCSKVYIPNVFTPNGDGLNDVFKPEGVCMVAYTMYIFDRWGELIYYTDASKPWDGTFKGTNTIVQEDTYVYEIIETDGFLKKHTLIGKVTVLK